MAARTTQQALTLHPGSPWNAHRRAVGMSIRRLAAVTGLDRGTLSRIDQGRQIPTPAEAEAMLAAFKEGTS